MKKTILLIAVISILILPAVSHAEYLIQLSNGGQFVTPQYWEEDREIRFYISGGVMGIEKNFVKKIEKFRFTDDSAYVVKPKQIPQNAGQTSGAVLTETGGTGKNTDSQILEKDKSRMRAEQQNRMKTEPGGLTETRQGAAQPGAGNSGSGGTAGGAIGQMPVPVGKQTDKASVLR